MTPHGIRLDEAWEQARLIENAILLAREKYAAAETQAFSAYVGSLLEELHAVRTRIDVELGVDVLRTDAASLWLRLRGGGVGDGRAPAHVVGKVLEAIQRGTRQAAAFIELGTAVLHRVPKEIGKEASLDVLAFARGSARIAVAPSVPQLRIDKPIPLAEMALQQLMAVALWAEAEEPDNILDELLPDPAARRQALSRIRDIAPSSSADYNEVDLSGPVISRLARVGSVPITPRAFSHASNFLRRRQEEPVTLGGRLVAIDIEKAIFDLRHKRGRTHCRFSGDLLPAAKRLIEEHVEVQGLGFFQRTSEVPYRVDVSTLRPLTLEERARLR